MSTEADNLSGSLELALSQRGIDLEGVRVDASGSIIPPDRSLPDNFDELIADLPILLDEDGSPNTHQLEIGALIGMGGMGAVHLAEQLALRRDVAVKVQHIDVESPMTTLQLLREARVTGYLEHPNIVPVHALGRDREGRPHIVMKAIEGEAWSTTIAERPATASDAGEDDNLTFHIETLLSVIRAVEFSHARGVLHLDIKPDNVMIGSFGEIYLVDWGVAVKTRDTVALSDVPLAEDIEHIVGTPQYMAPELVAAEGHGLSERTDVYLLGACLHHVVTGEAPHDGANLRGVFTAAYASRPKKYAKRWPRELVDIIHRAMHHDPTQRFEDVRAMGDALATFLRHRHGRTLAEQARERLRQLEHMLDELADEVPTPERRRAINDTFSACRFGYDLALREWAEHSRGRRGLQRCLERMIEFELRHGSAKAAASYLAELPKHDERLDRRVQAVLRHEDAKGEAFDRLRRDADVTVGDRLRGVVAIVTGTLWGVVHLYAGKLYRDPELELTHRHMIYVGVTFILGAIVTTLLGRRVFFNTAANTRLSVAYVTVFVAYTAVWLLASRIGIPPPWTLALFLVVSTSVWTVLALSSDRRMLPLPAALGSTIIAIAVLPKVAFELFGVASFVGPVAVALIWLSRRDTKR